MQSKAAADCGTYKAVRTRIGVRLLQHGTVLSEIRTLPGATQSVADVMAAVVQVVAGGPRVALLGFAGGGMLAPLRAWGGTAAVSGVDLNDAGWLLFQRHCAAWAGKVSFEQAEACGWLRRNRSRYDVIIEDLSVPTDSDVFKPAMTWSELPQLIYGRLTENGVAIFNLLHPTDGSWEKGFRRILPAGFAVRVINFTDYENRILIVSRQLPTARAISTKLRAHLSRIHSCLASRIEVRNCRVTGTVSC